MRESRRVWRPSLSLCSSQLPYKRYEFDAFSRIVGRNCLARHRKGPPARKEGRKARAFFTLFGLNFLNFSPLRSPLFFLSPALFAYILFYN